MVEDSGVPHLAFNQALLEAPQSWARFQEWQGMVQEVRRRGALCQAGSFSRCSVSSGGDQGQPRAAAEHLPTPLRLCAHEGEVLGSLGENPCLPPSQQQDVPGNGYFYQSVKLPAFQQSSSNFKVHLILHQVITDIPRSTLSPELSIW